MKSAFGVNHTISKSRVARAGRLILRRRKLDGGHIADAVQLTDTANKKDSLTNRRR